MADITIRNIPDETMSALRIKAAGNHRSIEDEVRDILCFAVLVDAQDSGLASRIASRIARRFAAEDGVEMTLPKRSTQRPAPDPD